MCMFICIFTNMNTIKCDQNKLMVKIFLSYLQLHVISSMFQLLLMKSLLTWTGEDLCLSNVKNSMVYSFYTRKDRCRE
jgi:hypothetical protein